jgi:transglutaminase-like putative cysteine protease
MKFNVTGHLGYEDDGPATIISSLHCLQTPGQEVTDESLLTSRPVDYHEMELGLGQNRFSRISVETTGPLSIDYSATVSTSVRRVPHDDLTNIIPGELSAEAIPYLFPSRYCESDMFRTEAARLFPPHDSPYQQVKAIVTWISQNITYVSGSTDEQSSASFVLAYRQGVCRDFAHLGIAFCRALTIPARYVTVYAYQLNPQDFHACFEAHIGGQWFIFDATGLAPLNGLIRIATGRDASDAAVASLFGAIQGTELSVSCECLEEHFHPITRDELHNTNEALILG